MRTDTLAPAATADALLAALQVRVDTARARLDEATTNYEYGRKNLTPGQASALRDERVQAWARLTEAQECLGTAARVLATAAPAPVEEIDGALLPLDGALF